MATQLPELGWGWNWRARGIGPLLVAVNAFRPHRDVVVPDRAD